MNIQLKAALLLFSFAAPGFGTYAICPNGLHEPCIQLNLNPLPLIPLAGPPLPEEIRLFQLSNPPPLAAPAQLAISAPASSAERVLQLRRRAAALLSEISFKGYEVSFQGLTTLLSPSPPYSADAESKLNEARRLLRDYFVVLREIEWITLGMNIGGKNFDQRVAQLQIVQGRINAINVDLNPLYTVHKSDATVHIEDANRPAKPNCRNETVYETKIIDIVVTVGFDERGNPIKRQGKDVQQRPRTIVVCD